MRVTLVFYDNGEYERDLFVLWKLGWRDKGEKRLKEHALRIWKKLKGKLTHNCLDWDSREICTGKDFASCQLSLIKSVHCLSGRLSVSLLSWLLLQSLPDTFQYPHPWISKPNMWYWKIQSSNFSSQIFFATFCYGGWGWRKTYPNEIIKEDLDTICHLYSSIASKSKTINYRAKGRSEPQPLSWWRDG